MRYRKNYKYQVFDQRVVFYNERLKGIVPAPIITPFIELYPDEGKVVIFFGYAWDGPSGPVIDRKTNRVPSLLHDALYELSRWEKIPPSRWRLYDLCFADELERYGAWKVTQKVDLAGLKIAQGKAAQPDAKKKVYKDLPAKGYTEHVTPV